MEREESRRHWQEQVALEREIEGLPPNLILEGWRNEERPVHDGKAIRGVVTRGEHTDSCERTGDGWLCVDNCPVEDMVLKPPERRRFWDDDAMSVDKVYVLFHGLYAEEGATGVYRTPEAAMAAYAPKRPDGERHTYEWGERELDGQWFFDADWDDAARITEYELEG